MKNAILAGLVVCAASVALGEELNGQQTRLLKDAEYYLKALDRELPPLFEQAERIKGLSDISTVPYNDVHKYLNQVNYSGQKLNNILSRLQQLPTAHPDVAAVDTKTKEYATSLLAAEAVFKNAKAKLDAIRNPEASPEVDAEKKRLEEMSLMIAMPSLMQSDPVRATGVCRDLPEMIAYQKEVAQKYAQIMNQETPQGRDLKAVVVGFEQRLQRFREEADKRAAALPGEIERHFANAESMARDAAETRYPRKFIGVGLQMKQAEERLGLLQALTEDSPASYNAMKAKYEATKKQLAKAESALEDEIIAANKPPNDLYDGADKKKLVSEVKQAWAKAYPKDEILGVRIPMREWERDTRWRWASVAEEFQKHDTSELQAAVIVKHNKSQARIFYVYLTKYHLKGDSIKLSLDDKKDVRVHQKLPLKNWR